MQALQLYAAAGKTGAAYPKNKIDLTDYDTVSAVVDANVSGGSAFSLYIVGTLGQTPVASATLSAGTATRVDLDVSSVTGSYYVVASLYSDKGAGAYVTEVSIQ